eukprot:scpid14016/ scgid3511/ TELO2-interacting protein 1 homolog
MRANCLLVTAGVLPRKLAEEEKLVLVECVKSLFLAADSGVRELLRPARLPVMGHVIALLLDLAHNERSRSLRVACMATLDTLCLTVRGLSSSMDEALSNCSSNSHQFDVKMSSDAKLDFECAFSLAHFLPGIASTLTKIMRGDEKQGQKVTQAAIYTWTLAVAFVLSDKNFPSTSNGSTSPGTTQPNGSHNGTTAEAAGQHRLPVVAYSTPDWWQKAAVQVNTLLQQLTPLQSHPQWKVRLFVARLASTLLEHCRRSLSASVTILVEMLVALIADGYSQVALVARTALTHFSHHLNTASVPLVSLLEDGMYRAASNLPSVMTATDDRKKLSCTLLLQGYIQLLGPKLSTILLSPRLSQRLFHALLMALEMDTSHASISISHSHDTDGNSAVRVAGAHRQHSQLTFRHFRDEAIAKGLLLSCSLLGYYGDLSSVVDSLLDILLLQPHLHKQVVLVINTAVSGAAGVGLDSVSDLQEQSSTEDFEQHVRFLLTEFTQPSVWHVPTEQPPLPATLLAPSSHSSSSNTHHQSLESRLRIVPATAAAADTILTRDMPATDQHRPVHPLSAEALRSNVLLVCLLLDGVRVFASILGEGFRQFILQSLFHVLEKAGSDNLMIRDAAYACLQAMATSCNYDSVSQLIGCNADYLLNLCTQHLRVLNQYAVATRVMRETLANSDDTLLLLLNAFLDEVLYVLELSTGTGKDLLLIPVLRASVCAVRRWSGVDTLPAAADSGAEVQASTENLAGQLNDLFTSSQSEGDELERDREPASMDEIREFFLDYHQQKGKEKEKEELADDEQEGMDDGEDIQDDSQPNDAKKLPDADNVGVRVLNYCVHLLSVTHVHSSLVVLDTVQQGVRLLQPNQEQLLPLVHQLWSPLLHRVRHTHLPIASKAVDLIAVLAIVAGDFIRKRVTNDIIPIFTAVLQQPVPAKYTQLHTLLLGIFDCLGTLSTKLDLPEEEIVSLSNMCVSYLSCKMPVSVQQAAVRLYKQWARSHGDCIWLLLIHLSSSVSFPTPPSELLPPLEPLTKIPSSITRDLDVNVTELLKCL